MLTALRAHTILTMVHSDQPNCRSKQTGTHDVVKPDNRRNRNCSSHSTALPAVIYDGVVVSEDGIIKTVSTYEEFCDNFSVSQTPAKAQQNIHPDNFTNLGKATILPAVINCHNHLELSHLKGKTVSGKGFEGWIKSLLPLLSAAPDPACIRAAVSEMVSHGTGYVGDITSRTPHHVLRATNEREMGCTLFMETFGYDFPHGFTSNNLWPAATNNLTNKEQDEHAALAGHALYSTHPVALAFAKQWCRLHKKTFSIHLAEHSGETELLVSGTGNFREQLSQRVLPPDYTPPAMRPVPYAMELGLLDEETLAVHCVQCSDEDIALLAQSGCSVCLCPRSNAYIGVGKPPVHKFMEAHIPLCLGTDSLASNYDMNIWNEARVLRDEYNIPVSHLLHMLTIDGANALGVADSLGTLESGKRFCYSVLPDDFQNNYFSE